MLRFSLFVLRSSTFPLPSFLDGDGNVIKKRKWKRRARPALKYYDQSCSFMLRFSLFALPSSTFPLPSFPHGDGNVIKKKKIEKRKWKRCVRPELKCYDQSRSFMLRFSLFVLRSSTFPLPFAMGVVAIALKTSGFQINRGVFSVWLLPIAH